MVGPVVPRGDVDDDEPLDEIWLRQRDKHRHLAAEGVADHGPRLAWGEATQGRGDMRGIRLQGEMVTPRRATMVGQVDERGASASAVVADERLGDLSPVTALTEKAVAERDSWA